MPRETYERFISLARQENVQLLRAWGAGILETETLYDVCDRYGVMVLQEFPGPGPVPLVEAAWRQFLLDRRNHPSLIWYGGGNELDFPYGEAITSLGRLAYELDGTRPFHRTDPFGGSTHDYGVYWGNSSFDWNLQLARRWPFIGEFGFVSLPNRESVQRYLPADEKDLWPAPPDRSFAFHTPAFNRDADYGRDISHIDHYVKMFLPCEGMSNCPSMADYIFASQIAQATAIRHPLEIMRTRWPQATGICYYKLTDVYPAASYSSIDWYGVPKLAHFIVADAYAPLLASATFKTLRPETPANLAEIFLLDDANRLDGKPWRVRVRGFDGVTLREIGQESWEGRDGGERVIKLGEFSLPAGTIIPTPLLLVTDVSVGGVPAKRTFYWLNFESRPGCLRESSPTTLRMERSGRTVTVWNTGKVPAVAVNFVAPSVSDRFWSDANYFWLDPGEKRRIRINMLEGLEGVTAWNMANRKPPGTGRRTKP